MKLRMLVVLILATCFATTLSAQDLACLSVDDQRVIRQIIADREFYKKSFEEAQAQKARVEQSRDGWKSLFEAEKLRADEVQGGRVDELKKEVGDLRLANTKLHDQHAADTKHMGEQNAEIADLKSARKWWFGAGTVLGGAGGYLLGRQVGAAGGVTNIITGQGGQARGFRVTFGF